MPTTFDTEIIEAPSGIIFECCLYPNGKCWKMNTVTLTAYQAFVRGDNIGLVKTPYAYNEAAEYEYKRLFSGEKKVLAYREQTIEIGKWSRAGWHINDGKEGTY